MSKLYRPWNPGQASLFPASPSEWLPKDHLVYFILDVVSELDLSAIFDQDAQCNPGRAAYSPRMMTALLLYAYCVGVPSSRRIEKRTYEDVAFRVLTADQHPDHTRISEFRRVHLEALSGLFVQVLRLCQRAGLVRLGHVSLDGAKFKANASKRKAMSYKRMGEEEKRLQKLVSDLLASAEAADDEEDTRYGKDRRGDELPEDLQRAESRLQRIRELKAALEEEAEAQRLEEEAAEDDEDPDGPSAPSGDLPRHKIPRKKDGKPTDKAQRNFTDPESRIMKSSADGFVQGYNCQAMADDKAQVIVAQGVTNQPPDCQHLRPLLDQVEENLGELPRELSGDNGYFSAGNIEYAEARGVDAYIAAGTRKGDGPVNLRGRIPKGLSTRDRMRRKLATKRGAKVYSRRKVIIEPVFGQIKECRGLRRFLLRGLEKVRAEFALYALTHNLLKLFRSNSYAPA